MAWENKSSKNVSGSFTQEREKFDDDGHDDDEKKPWFLPKKQKQKTTDRINDSKTMAKKWNENEQKKNQKRWRHKRSILDEKKTREFRSNHIRVCVCVSVTNQFQL